MDSYLANFKAVCSDILTDIETSLPDIDIMYGVADYKDHTNGGFYNLYGVKLIQPFTDKTTAVQAAINGLFLSGGGIDWPENQLKGMVSIAENWLTTYGALGFSGRADALKIIIWAGDAPGHVLGDPPLGYHPSLDTVIEELTARGIMVFALNTCGCNSGINLPYDEPPRQQASEITLATNGTLYCNVGSGGLSIKDAIVDAITGFCHLSLSKVDDITGCIGPGDEINYTISYNYHGDPTCCTEDINDVNIIDELPTELEFWQASDDGSYDSEFHTVTWSLGSLLGGESGSVTVTSHVENPQPGSTITNSCEISSGGQILDTAYEYTSVCSPLLWKIDDIIGCIDPGDKITYTICFKANGYSITDVDIVDTLPSEVDYVESTPEGQYNDVPRTVTWDIGTLGPDDVCCVTLTVEAPNPQSGSIITNSCEAISGGQTLGTDYENTFVCPWPELTKVDNITNCVGTGDYITYTICYDPNGRNDTNVALIDELPAGVEFESASHGGVPDPGPPRVVTWLIDQISPTEPNEPNVICVTLKVRVTDAEPGSIITNPCEITIDEEVLITAYEDTNVCWANDPTPRSGAVSVVWNPDLNWEVCQYVDAYDVYLGTDFNEVSEANRTNPLGVLVSINQESDYYKPAILESDTIYYWRIDVVNEPDIWKGCVWWFQTGKSLSVEDFDSYTDSFALQALWVPDGNSGANPSLETAKVQAGQSMKYEYVDTGFHNYYSEVDADVCDLPGGIGTDWTIGGVEALTLYFHGDPNNDVNEPMYVRLADANINATVTYGDYGEDTNNVNKPEWHEWNIALTDFAGVNQSNIKQITIGFGDKDGPDVEGTVYFDDIRLYAPRCVPEYAGDLTGNCVVDFWDLKIMIDKWLYTSNFFAADIYRDCKVDFKDFAALAESWLEEGQMWPAE